LKETPPSYKDLEPVKNHYAGRDYSINIEIPEFNCLCPRTGLPDFATIKIDYVPDSLILELKSLKLYIVKYRNVGVFHEHVTNQILEDFIKAVSPKRVRIVGSFNSRGGIQTDVEASWEK
tara:strand:- start:120 stop:479 length:360 start_codon:yes stop_codon:yes gene_type:complete